LHDEAAVNLPDDVVAVLEAGLPAAIAKAREDLEPVEPEEVVMALQAWADRRNLPLPEGLSLDLDVETMSAWPRVVFREAFRRAWERFSYPRVPTAAELHRYVAEDVKQARGRLASLDTAARKLETIRMRRRWDEEARSRHAATKAKERAEWQQRDAANRSSGRLSVGETTTTADSPVGENPCSVRTGSTETSRYTGIPPQQPAPAQDPEQAPAVVSPTDAELQIASDGRRSIPIPHMPVGVRPGIRPPGAPPLPGWTAGALPLIRIPIRAMGPKRRPFAHSSPVTGLPRPVEHQPICPELICPEFNALSSGSSPCASFSSAFY
jgi:hypothetical protein